MKNLRWRGGILIAAALLWAACDDVESDDDATSDSGSDVGDTGTGDSGRDIGVDTGSDVATDTATDSDATTDLGEDAVADAAPDVQSDVESDVEADVEPDASGDLGGDLAGDAGHDAVSDMLDDGGPIVLGARFAIEVNNDVPESIWVQTNDAISQIGWVTVFNDIGNPVYFTERCDIEECEDPSGVCGIAQERVRDITGGDFTGSIETFWEGEMSLFEGEPFVCERRAAAPAGDYEARFCFSTSATLDEGDDGDPTVGVAGTVDSPVCITVDFTWPTDEVVYRISGG